MATISFPLEAFDRWRDWQRQGGDWPSFVEEVGRCEGEEEADKVAASRERFARYDLDEEEEEAEWE